LDTSLTRRPTARDLDALRVPSSYNRLPVLDLGLLASVGVYAGVLQPGRIRVGDGIRVMAH
jgi:MOSC domain-containing protein YiiM